MHDETKRTNETHAGLRREELREAKQAKRSPVDGTFAVVIIILAANALTAFAIQAWMTYGFAKKVWELPTQLCFALIIALDIFAIMYMVLTYLLRGTGRPRFLATVVFLFAIAAQVFAAEQFGEHEQWSTEVRWFAVFPALALALSQEGVILWRTHRNDKAAKRQGQGKAERAETPSKPPAPVKRPAAEVTPATPRPAMLPAPAVRKERPETGKVQVKAPAKARKDDGGKQERRAALVADILANRTTTKEVAYAEGVSLRAVQLWVKEHETAPEPAEPVRLVPLVTEPLTSTNVRPINGNAPGTEVTR